jgi:hypothetical protein
MPPEFAVPPKRQTISHRKGSPISHQRTWDEKDGRSPRYSS